MVAFVSRSPAGPGCKDVPHRKRLFLGMLYALDWLTRLVIDTDPSVLGRRTMEEHDG